MHLLALQAAAQGGGQIESVASAFGVDWTHLIAESISFGIVCFVLYKLAYTPILQILEARRQQIALGLANASKIKAHPPAVPVRVRCRGERPLPAASRRGRPWGLPTPERFPVV